jgi:hypothetical protein
MTLWVQHGYGKSDKIDQLAAAHAISGVILSSGGEELQALQATASHCRTLGLEVTLDPQTYVYTIPNGTAARHASHGLEFGPVHWSVAPSEVERHVKAVLTANQALGLDGPLVAPTCLQRGFNDVWTPLAIQYARTTVAAATDRDVYVSLVIDEGGLTDWEPIDGWLDLATTLDARGFYLVIARSSSDYPGSWDAARLCNALRLIYRLATLNEYDVVWGYADLEGLLGLAAGCTAIGSGWHHSLRVFCEGKWQPSPPGGRQPVARVTSGSLLTPLRAVGEVDAILTSPEAASAFPDDALRTRLSGPGTETWSRPESQMQHLVLLGELSQQVGVDADVAARMARVQGWLSHAIGMFADLQALGVILPTAYRARLDALLLALDSFATSEDL